MSAAPSELGPVLPPAWRIEMEARELVVLAKRMEEFAATGPRHDLQLALRQRERMMAMLGGKSLCRPPAAEVHACTNVRPSGSMPAGVAGSSGKI